MTRAIGIDISHWDGTFDPQLATKPIDFVIQKASEGLYRDSKFLSLLNGVLKVPIRGAYHYLRSGYGWQAQADYFISVVKDRGYHFYACDFESIGNTLNATFAAMTWEWIKYVTAKTGKIVLLYTNPNHYDVDLWPYGDWMKNYPLWLAQYYTDNPSPERTPRLPIHRVVGDWKIWQWASEINYQGHGHEYGVQSASVDLDAFNGTKEAMQKWIRGIGIVPPPILKKGYVNTSYGLNVRNMPNTFGKILYVLPYKAIVTIYDEKNGWYKISNSAEEWVYANYITLM